MRLQIVRLVGLDWNGSLGSGMVALWLPVLRMELKIEIWKHPTSLRIFK